MLEIRISWSKLILISISYFYVPKFSKDPKLTFWPIWSCNIPKFVKFCIFSAENINNTGIGPFFMGLKGVWIVKTHKLNIINVLLGILVKNMTNIGQKILFWATYNLKMQNKLLFKKSLKCLNCDTLIPSSSYKHMHRRDF